MASMMMQLGVVLNLAVTIATLCFTMVVPWVRYNHEVSQIPPAETVYESKEVGLWRCYGAECALKGQPKPFFWGGILALGFLSLATVLAIASVMAESSRGRDTDAYRPAPLPPATPHRLMGTRFPQQLHLWAFLALVAAPAVYWMATFHFLAGGAYMSGMWLALGAAGVSVLLLAMQHFMGPHEEAGYLPVTSVTRVEGGKTRSPHGHRGATESTALRV